MSEEIGFEYRSLFPKIKNHNLESMLETSTKLCSMYSYYRRNVCAKNEHSMWKIVEVRNFTHCPPKSKLDLSCEMIQPYENGFVSFHLFVYFQIVRGNWTRFISRLVALMDSSASASMDIAETTSFLCLPWAAHQVI